MSFLYKASTSAFRVARLAPRAAFSTSVRSQKSAIDVAKETLKEVDRTVADAAVKGIEKGGRLHDFNNWPSYLYRARYLFTYPL
jgi:hypothetical protein